MLQYNGTTSLFAGGSFTTIGSTTVNHVARYDGQQWTPLGDGLTASALALLVHDDGAGESLFVGGGFSQAGGQTVNGLARWNGADWSPVGGAATGNSLNGSARAFAVQTTSAGTDLYVGGGFTLARNVPANRVAKWNGTEWSAVGEGFDGLVRTLAFYETDGIETLYAGGDFTHAGSVEVNGVARWSGTAWEPMGRGVRYLSTWASVYAMTIYDDGSGPMLYVGGRYSTVDGLPADGLAKWDGATWTPVLGLRDVAFSGRVYAMSVWDDGQGPALFVGGYFDRAGAEDASSIARWDGANWSRLRAGVQYLPGGYVPTVSALKPFGSHLYVGGFFDRAGAVDVRSIARWNGNAWSNVGGGVSDPWLPEVLSMIAYDDGSGDALYVGGRFTEAGGVPANHIARWRLGEWSSLGDGVDHVVYAATPYKDRSGRALYVGGTFLRAAGQPSHYMARWGCGFDRGDLNCGGTVDAFDVEPFILALVDPQGYSLAYPDCFVDRADANGDGVIDAFDIEPFIQLLVGP